MQRLLTLENGRRLCFIPHVPVSGEHKFSCCAGWLYVNLSEAQVVREEETLIEKVPLPKLACREAYSVLFKL